MTSLHQAMISVVLCISYQQVLVFYPFTFGEFTSFKQESIVFENGKGSPYIIYINEYA